MEFLESLEVILIASAVVVLLLHKLKIPSIVGFLIAGAIIGPYGIGFIKDTHSVELLAEIGVILLLFAVGIEFSLSRLLRMRRAVIGGGGLQVSLTIAASAVLAYLVTGDLEQSVFIGFLIALSSTAIVLKLLAERGEIDTPHGRMMTGMLIFQDLCVVPLMLVTPALAGEGVNIADIAVKMGKAVLIVGSVLFAARWVVPSLLHQVVRTRSRELFITTIILLCLGISLITARFGLSLALGAFLAGLIVSESEYAHQATVDILPFKESFMGLFFVSVGMLMNTGYLYENLPMVAVAVLVIFGLKAAVGVLSSRFAGGPLRISIHTGLGIAQIGEFSFVIALAGKSAGLIGDDFYQLFLSASAVTMMLTPFAMKAAPSVSAWAASNRILKRAGGMEAQREKRPSRRRDHVIIVGFGLNGRNLARVLREADIPFVVLELNSDTVREMRSKGVPIYYGDATSREMLLKMGIDKARLLVVAISDPVSTRRIVSIAKHENPGLYTIVRTRYVVEIGDLKSLGADEVIPEEFETSIEIFSKVLERYNFPGGVIMDMVNTVRSDGYTALRSATFPVRRLFDKCEWLPEMDIDGFRVPEGSPLAGRSIAELQVRKKTGATVIAVRRGPKVYTNPQPDFEFKESDIILFTGERESMERAGDYFRGEKTEEPAP